MENSKTVIQIPLRPRDLLSVYVSSGISFRQLINDRYIEIDPNSLMGVNYTHDKKAVFASFKYENKIAQVYFPSNSPATVLLQPYADASAGPHKFSLSNFLTRAREYFPYSAVLIYILTIIFYIFLTKLIRWPSPHFFLKENCDIVCATALSKATRSILLFPAFTVLGFVASYFAYKSARQNLKYWSQVRAAFFEAFYICIVCAFVAIVFVQKFASSKGPGVYAKWLHGEKIDVKTDRVDFASKAPMGAQNSPPLEKTQGK